MKIIGIICEYNPFHNGHQKQLRAIRARFGEDAAIVCLMSGNYVQRGEPAIFDKSLRARVAVACGADLMLELPLTYALRSAEGFADGGVEILNALGVDVLCFGCESGDSNYIMSTAKMLRSPEFEPLLRKELERGVSYAAAREAALSQLMPADALRNPNDILAVEYCKAILRHGSQMEIFALQREGDYHGETENPENPSASHLRACISETAAPTTCRQIITPEVTEWESSVPPVAAALYRGAPTYTLAAGERAMLARLRMLSDADFEALPYGSEGLWSRFRKACRTESSVEAIIEATKSKRYARSRIQRMLLCAYLGITESDLHAKAPYVRALAFNDRGRTFLHNAPVGAIHETPELQPPNGRPIRESPLREEPNDPWCPALINAGQTPEDAACFALECRASDLYTLFCTQPAEMRCLQEQRRRVVYLPDESARQS